MKRDVKESMWRVWIIVTGSGKVMAFANLIGCAYFHT
jgi:hypothetical protein